MADVVRISNTERESLFRADCLILLLQRAALPRVHKYAVVKANNESESEMYLFDPYKYVQSKLKRNDFGSEDS